MKNPLMFLLVLSVGSLSLWGCGSAGGGGGSDYQAGGEKLSVVAVNPVEGTSLTVNVVKQTNDYGEDNTATTFDQGENDGLPTDGETLIKDVQDYYVTLTLKNTERLQQGQSTPLKVRFIDVSYHMRDADGPARFVSFTRQYPSGTLTLEPGETGDVILNLLPLAVIAQRSNPSSVPPIPAGPEEIFLTKNNTLIDPIRNLTAVLDIYAEDANNTHNETNIQYSVSIALQNPMEHR